MRIHVILNSHLDPVWLWRKPQGIDKVLATARTACDILDSFPEVKITRGEMWFYETVEQCDPALFERIREHVRSGRWCIVGGWYVQADCNLTHGETFAQHNRICSEYFRKKFGFTPHTGYHVDSFGHGAFMPSFLNANGIRHYVMMRPSEKEMHIGSADFIWEDPNGGRVRVFRIPRAYATCYTRESVLANLDAAEKAATKALDAVMCFAGVGDHGGGPARAEVEYLLQEQKKRKDVELLFSTPDRYFAETEDKAGSLPVVRTELQHHAIGCYSAVPRIKREIRTAEYLLAGTGRFLKRHPESGVRLTKACQDELWKKILFASFHDILPGSSIREAYEDIYDDLGMVRSKTRSLLELAIRRINSKLPPAPDQRLVVDNLADRAFSGFAEFEPWLQHEYIRSPEIRLLDERGQDVPFQRIATSSGLETRLFFPVRIPSGGRCVFFLRPCKKTPIGETGSGAEDFPVSVHRTASGLDRISCAGRTFLKRIRFRIYPDSGDTWSHGFAGFSTEADEHMRLRLPWKECESGPLLHAHTALFSCADGTLRCRTGLALRESVLDLKIRVNWHGVRRLLKMELEPAFPAASRIDGVPGGRIPRALNGEEYPITSFTSVSAADGRTISAISPDITSVDVQESGTIRLTLLRSPYYAHHDPLVREENSDYPLTAQGEQEIHLRLLLTAKPDFDAVRREETLLADPLVFSESTFGVKPAL